MAAAYRAGAALADLEFVQFHPTTLVDSSLLLSEALRGEGALLLDEQGNRFTDELAPRDVVAREIAARGTVLLDLRAIDRGRFPTLMGSLVDEGYDPAQTPIPVAPAAHYTSAASSPISTDAASCRACTRRASARRPASTARTASRRTRCSSASSSDAGRRSRRSPSPGCLHGCPGLPPTSAEPEPVTPELRTALWRDCGLIRDAAGPRASAATRRICSRASSRETALTREESRGSHFRADFPSESEAFERHVVLRPGAEPALESWL